MMARMRSITRGDLKCLEFMLATTDLLSHHMRILLSFQRGPHKIQAKYMRNNSCHSILMGGAVASWLVRSTPDRVVRVRGLAGDIALCSWARHFTLTVPLSTQVYNWLPA